MSPIQLNEKVKNNNKIGFIDDEILPISQDELKTENNFFEKRDDDCYIVTFEDEFIK